MYLSIVSSLVPSTEQTILYYTILYLLYPRPSFMTMTMTISCMHCVPCTLYLIPSFDAVRSDGHSANKDSLLGFYPTEVQAAMACDDNTRRTAAPPPAETSGTTSGNSMDVDDAAVNDASSTPSTAAAAAGSSGASSTSGTSTSLPLTLNFTSDEEAQERLDAVAMFEAGLNPEDGSEADPSLVVVASKGGQLRTLRDLQKERDALRLGGAADHSPEDGGVNGNGASPMEVEDGGKAFSTRDDDAENGGGHGQKERQQNGADGCVLRAESMTTSLILHHVAPTTSHYITSHPMEWNGWRVVFPLRFYRSIVVRSLSITSCCRYVICLLTLWNAM